MMHWILAGTNVPSSSILYCGKLHGDGHVEPKEPRDLRLSPFAAMLLTMTGLGRLLMDES